MAFEHYIRSGNKMLRCGFTTGTCAALAAAGAAALLLTGEAPEQLALTTPNGVPVRAAPAECRLAGNAAVCSVVKDAGDDPDVTDGMHVTARVSRSPAAGVHVDGGEGVGRVTRRGLDQPVGASAINRVPRQMIADEVLRVCDQCGYDGGLDVLISIPGGAAAALKTFNPDLGVEGGLSVLGTSGIVEPMSTQAVIDTISVELHQAALAPEHRVILTPGNYGLEYLQEAGLADGRIPIVKFSNYLGDALDIAAAEGFEQVLLVGHIGKLVKAAGGIMNTHSKQADCRRELITAHAAVCSAGPETCRRLMNAVTTDDCIAILKEENRDAAVLASLMKAIRTSVERRVQGAYTVGTVLFSRVYGCLGETDTAKELIAEWKP